MIIYHNDSCVCGVIAAGHTVGVFSTLGRDNVDLAEIWKNQSKFNKPNLVKNGCGKFIPKDNLKYLEMKYEESKEDSN